MSKALNLINFNDTFLTLGDADGMRQLASFLLALSRTDLKERGCVGDAKIVYRNSDYHLLFGGSVSLGRSSHAGAVLFREHSCPIPECEIRTYSTNGRAEFCKEHWTEMHCEGVA